MGNFTSSQAHDEWKSDAQHAMEAGTFCVICGGPFDLHGDVYNIDPKDPRFQVRPRDRKGMPYTPFIDAGSSGYTDVVFLVTSMMQTTR